MNTSMRRRISGPSLLAADLQAVTNDAQRLLKDIAAHSADTFDATRAQLGEKLDGLRSTVQEARAAMADRSAQAVDVAQRYVADHPWKSVALIAVSGIVLGWLMRRE